MKDLKPGSVISHYTISEKLGEGGMGVVYKAEDIKLKRTVALKFLPEEVVKDAEARKRFLREARAALSLDHTHIGTIYEVHDDDDNTFIVMAYYEGDTLQDLIKSGPLPVKDAIDICLQAARGLEKAHKKHIVHRDIKPSNILLTGEGQVKIIDFGLAKGDGKTMLTKEGTTLGTAQFMSPEQAQGQEADQRTDIWSLGVVLYTLLTGQLPFQGDYEQAIMYAILNETPEPVTGLRTGIPIAVDHILEKAMAKDPAERYQHIEDMIVDLAKVIKNRKEESTSGQSIPVRRKQKIVVPLFAGILVPFLVCLAAVYFFFLRSNRTIDSVAIMPFVNESGNPDLEYLSDGITENLISTLALLEDLKVMSRYSVFRYKGKDIEPKSIGEELNVRAVLLGRIVQRDDDLTVSLELVDTKDDHQIWGAMSYNMMGEYSQALDRLDLIQEKARNWSPWMAERIYTLVAVGRNAEAEEVLERILNKAEKQYVEPYFGAVAYAGFKNIDKTFEWLDKALAQRNLRIMLVKVDPKMAFLRNDPRYAALLKKIGLEET